MFIGEYKYIIDSKKRLAIPAKFRAGLGGKAVVTKGLDNSLFLYSKKEWQVLAEKLSSLPLSQSDARGFTRLMLAGAMEVSIDKAGRILIPDYLKEYAGLNKETVVIGLFNRIEIWSQEHWNEYQQKTEKEVGDMAERLKELGV
ncbi:MAG TPA: division/cell wall cluster transcriptional repressor MraZ [Candidatus Pacearchaeota archaeon]|nr:division/cell wall cluster transcriptional repressor MraZ [Candidatus Pacearchaeota archaeon]